MSLVAKNNKFIKLLNEFSYSKKFLFILGFLTPIPLFINLEDLSLMLIRFNPIIAYLGTDTDIPIPIGFISSIIFIFLILKKTNNLSKFIKTIIIFLFIFGVTYYKFGTLRVLSILSPFIFFIGFWKILFAPYRYLLSYSYGYLLGLSSFITLNVISFITFSLIDIYSLETSIESEIIRNVKGLNLNFARQIFNLEIYQYYISVTAIVSIALATLIFLKINNEYKNKYLNHLLTYIIITSFLISSFSLRKTTLIELSCISFLILINKLLNRKVAISFWLLLTLSFTSINIFLISNTRILNFTEMAASRPYFRYVKIIFNNASFSDILFGSSPMNVISGIRGFSNIFLELIYTSGLIGLLLYAILLTILLKRIYSKFSGKLHLQLIIILIFSSLLIGNLFNLNLTQPYYVCNLFSILIFSYTLSNQEIIKNNKISNLKRNF